MKSGTHLDEMNFRQRWELERNQEIKSQRVKTKSQNNSEPRKCFGLWLMANGEWHHCHSNFSLITLSLLSFGQSSNYPTGFVKKQWNCQSLSLSITYTAKPLCFVLHLCLCIVWFSCLFSSREKMRRFPVKSNLTDSSTEPNKLKHGGNEQPLCPKPRRPAAAVPEFLKPPRCSKHSFDNNNQANDDGKSGGLNIITEKVKTFFYITNNQSSAFSFSFFFHITISHGFFF